MIPSPATMLKNLEQRAASNFLMENLLQSKTPNGEFSLTLNWAASIMARQREKEIAAAAAAVAITNKKLNNKNNIDIDNNIDDDNNIPMRIDNDLETETEPETDGELTTNYRDNNLSRLNYDKLIINNNDDKKLNDNDYDIDRDWQGQYIISKTDDRLINNDETSSQQNYCDEQCQRDQTSPSHLLTSSSNNQIDTRNIQIKEKPELKFGVKAILADDYERRRNSENLQALQMSTGYSLQTSPTIQSGYPSSLAKPIARPAAYHPHHPPHPSHPPGPPAQHHFPTHTHHALQLLACRGPYITVSNPATGSGQLISTSGSFPPGMQPGITDLASMSINHPCFPWAQTSRGRPRKGMMRRAVFSDTQRRGLEKRFVAQKYISKPDRKKLAEKLGLKDSQVKIWFQNRRMKWRNTKERELMANGGSREQTLPNKNNPNPDLSDTDLDRRGDIIEFSPPSSPLKIQEITSDNEENEEINVT